MLTIVGGVVLGYLALITWQIWMPILGVVLLFSGFSAFVGVLSNLGG